MRRYSTLILFAIVLITPFVLGKLYGNAAGNARQPGADELVIITSHVEGVRREFAEAFKNWQLRQFGSAAKIIYLNYGGSADTVKYFRSAQDTSFKQLGTFKIDLVWGGGDYLFKVQLADYLDAVSLPRQILDFAFPHPSLNGIELYDTQRHTWFGTALASFGICYNKDVCRSLGVALPKTWNDLGDAGWSNWLALADPSRSTSAATAFMIIVERAMLDAKALGLSQDQGWAQGMGAIRLISSNAKIYTDSGSTVPSIISAGDAGAGMVIDFYGRSQMEAVGAQRMSYLEPAGATAINPDPIGLIKGAEHRQLAIQFIEFVLSEQGQRLWNTRAGVPCGPRQTSLRRLPIAPAVYADLSDFTDPVNPFAGNLAFDSSNQRRKTFPILGELIRMSCIDLLDELRNTRQGIERAGRTDLRQKLGVFPFDQAEALRRMEAWRVATPMQKFELERAWKADFRAEYQSLRNQADHGQHAPGF